MNVEARTGANGGGVPWWIVGIAGLLAVGFGVFIALRSTSTATSTSTTAATVTPATTPTPKPEPKDAFIASGRALFEERCASCHGASGRGDGPIAKAMGTMAPANLVDADWKHGDTPEQVLAVLNNGVKDTSMPGYRGLVPDDQLRAVAAYVLQLGGKPVPDSPR